MISSFDVCVNRMTFWRICTR